MPVLPAESITVNPRRYGPAVVGVPLSIPGRGWLMDRPGICVPTEFGEKKSPVPVPPTTLKVILTGTPTLKDGSTAGRTVSATGTSASDVHGHFVRRRTDGAAVARLHADKVEAVWHIRRGERRTGVPGQDRRQIARASARACLDAVHRRRAGACRRIPGEPDAGPVRVNARFDGAVGSFANAVGIDPYISVQLFNTGITAPTLWMNRTPCTPWID